MVDISTIPAGLLKAPVDEADFAAALPERYQVLNLTGCSADSIKYMLDRGYAVTAQYQNRHVLIVGYDQYNFWIYSRTAGEASAVASDDATAAFAESGNVFLTYGEV